jgi:hypothetical protein
MSSQKILAAVTLLATALSRASAQTTAPALSGDQVVDRISPAAVSILVGKGDGQVAGVASGVIIRSDGVILTANHVVRGMREVQVRLKNGEIYDQVELGTQERKSDFRSSPVSRCCPRFYSLRSPNAVRQATAWRRPWQFPGFSAGGARSRANQHGGAPFLRGHHRQ